MLTFAVKLKNSQMINFINYLKQIKFIIACISLLLFIRINATELTIKNIDDKYIPVFTDNGKIFLSPPLKDYGLLPLTGRMTGQPIEYIHHPTVWRYPVSGLSCTEKLLFLKVCGF